MPVQRLKSFLDRQNIKYVVITHSPAFTAQEIASSAHIPGKELAKTVVVRLDDELAMVVLPAPAKISFDLLRQATGAEQAELATEREFMDLFPGCELGAMPPFGNLYGMRVFIDEWLTMDDEIAFNAGSHTELIRMSFRDYSQLVQPVVARLSHHALV
jgi:Ala-tRNA(Pro) deacylase